MPNQRFQLKWDGGVNLLKDPKAIADNEWQRLENLFPTMDGVLAKRPGLSPLTLRNVTFRGSDYAMYPLIRGAQICAPETGAEIVAAGHWYGDGYTSPPRPCLFATLFDRVNIVSGNGPCVRYDLPIEEAGELLPYRPCFVNYRGETLVFVQGFEGFFALRPGAGPLALDPTLPYHFDRASFVYPNANVTGTVPTQPQALAVKPRTACVYRDRLHMFNFGPGMGAWMVVADSVVDLATLDPTSGYAPVSTIVGPDVLSVNGRHVEFRAMQLRNDSVVCGKEIMLRAVGTPIDTALLVLGRRTAVICTGEITRTSDTGAENIDEMLGDFRGQVVNYDCGTVSAETVVQTPYGTFWASDDEVWFLTEGTAPVPVGTKIRSALRNTPPERRWQWSAAYAKGVYVLQLITAMSTDDDNPASEFWWLDLRNGPPQSFADAKWFGPMTYAPYSPPNFGDATPGAGASFSNVFADTRPELGSNGRILTAVSVGGPSALNEPAKIPYAAEIAEIVVDEPQDPHDRGFTVVQNALPWTASTLYNVGDVIQPASANLDNHPGVWMVCSVAGTTGGTEPVWDFPTHDTWTDGGVTWKEIYAAADPAYFPLSNNTDDEVTIDGVSKEFDFGSAFADKQLQELDLSAQASVPSDLIVGVIQKGGAQTDYLVGNSSGVIDPSTFTNPLQLNVATFSGGDMVPMANQFQERAMYAADGTIISSARHTFRITDALNGVGQYYMPGGDPDHTTQVRFVALGLGSFEGIVFAEYTVTVLSGSGYATLYDMFESVKNTLNSSGIAAALSAYLPGLLFTQNLLSVPTNSPYIGSLEYTIDPQGLAGDICLAIDVNSGSSYSNAGRRLAGLMGMMGGGVWCDSLLPGYLVPANMDRATGESGSFRQTQIMPPTNPANWAIASLEVEVTPDNRRPTTT